MKTIMASLCALLFGTISLYAQTVYPDTIGTITNKIVRQGNAFRIVLVSTLGDSQDGVRFSVSDPSPITPRFKPTVDSLTGVFTYICDSADVDPFTIEFTARKGSSTDQQTIEITPLVLLPPEVTTFGLLKNSEFKEIKDQESNEVTYTIGRTYTRIAKKPFNSAVRDTLSEALIIGRTVTLEKDHPNNLYQRYVQDGLRYDLEAVTIVADKVVIKDTLYFPGAKVTIRARELRFEDKNTNNRAMIITQPIEYYDTTSSSKSPHSALPSIVIDRPGSDGFDGGSIDLFVKQVVARGNTVRFVLNGSSGQSTLKKGSAIAPPAGKGGNGGTFTSLSIVTDTAGKPINFSNIVRSYAGFNGFKDGVRDNSSGMPIDGSRTVASDALSNWKWFSPYIFRLSVRYAKDAYRERHLEFAYQLADQIRKDLKAIIDSVPPPVMELWNSADQMEIQLVNEDIDALQYRIAGNMDYYGYPAGWVPMLSLNALTQVFKNEIPSAMQAIALGRWIGGIGDSINITLDGFKSMRSLLANDVVELNNTYDDKIKTLPGLYEESENTEKAIEQTIASIEQRRRELQERASSIVADRHKPKKQKKWQRIAKIVGTVAQFSPFFQPAAGIVGQGLIIASEYDKNDPNNNIFGTIGKVQGLVAQYNDMGGLQEILGQTGKGFKEQVTQLNPQRFRDDLEKAKTVDDYKNLNDRVKEYYKNNKKMIEIRDSISKIREILRTTRLQTTAPSSEIEAEYNRLQAEDPSYNNLIQQSAALQVKSERLTTTITQNTEVVTSSYSQINTKILEIDALNRNIDKGISILDERVLTYAKDMQQEAFDRMNKYHYFIAKAYEYQFMTPYTGKMDLDSLIINLEQFAKNGSAYLNSGKIDPSQYSLLEGVYRRVLSALVNKIVTDAATTAGKNLAVGTAYPLAKRTLTVDELSTLNSTGQVTISLDNEFSSLDENVRIKKVQFSTIKASKIKKAIEVILSHSGVSEKWWQGKKYLFRHNIEDAFLRGDDPRTDIYWSGLIRKDVADVTNGSNLDNEEMISFLRDIAGVTTSNDAVFVKPSALGTLTLFRNDEENDVPIDSLVLDFEVFSSRRISSNQSYLNVRTTLPYVQPLIKVDLGTNVWGEDNMSRKNGRGKFVRSYTKGVVNSLTAPPRYGYWSFNRWIESDASGKIISQTGKLTTTTKLDEDKYWAAEYQIPYSIPDGIVCYDYSGFVKQTIQANDSLIMTIPAVLDQSVLIDKSDTSESKLFLEQNAQWGWVSQDSAARNHQGYELRNNLLYISNPKEDDTVTVFAHVHYGGARHYLNRSFVLRYGVLSVKDNLQSTIGYSNPIKVFPNPASDHLTIHFKHEQHIGYVHIAFIDIQGRIVQTIFKGHLDSGYGEWNMKTTDIPSGAYSVVASTPTTQYSMPLQVVR